MDYHFGEAARRAYVDREIERVDGWLEVGDKILIASLCEIQTGQGVTGSLGEIGVHHGKLFLLLYLYLHAGEKAFCVDVFEQQDLNVDGSGLGSESIFLDNLARYAEASRLHLIKDTSLNIDPEAMIEAVGRARLVSIDGGHTAEITRNDMEKCEAFLADDGIVIIDDYFNPAWPGVSEGVIAYAEAGRGRLVPFAIGRNKIFFCLPERRDGYRQALVAARREMLQKTTSFLGHEVEVFSGYETLSRILGYTRLGWAGALAERLEGAHLALRTRLAARCR